MNFQKKRSHLSQLVYEYLSVDRNKNLGFTLVEPLLIISVVALLAILINNTPSTVYTINKSKHVSVARMIAQKKLENFRKLGYENLVITTSPIIFTDSELSVLKNSNATYEVINCPTEICTLGDKEKAKVVRTKVAWDEVAPGKNGQLSPDSVELTTIISAGGLAQ